MMARRTTCQPHLLVGPESLTAACLHLRTQIILPPSVLATIWTILKSIRVLILASQSSQCVPVFDNIISLIVTYTAPAGCLSPTL